MTVQAFTREQYEALGVEAPWRPPFALENRAARDEGGTGHYYASRGTTILGICVHITAGITDLDAPDTSAEATTNYGRTTTTAASWTVIVDSDTIINSLHPDRVGFVQGVTGYNFNRPLMGIEIGKKDPDWRIEPEWWVDATLRNAAAACAPYVIKYGIPLRVLTDRDEIQRLIEAGQPVGFTEHWNLTPSTRSDAGRVGSGTTFPWERFFTILREAIARLEGEAMPIAENGWSTVRLATTSTFLAPNGKVVYCRDRDVATILGYVAWRWHLSVEPIAPATYLEGDSETDYRGGVRDGRTIAIHSWRPAAQIAGSTYYSIHGTGMAMDVNGHLHPYEHSETQAGRVWRSGFTDAQVTELRRIKSEIRALAGGADILRLGLDFAVGRRDGMHVELWATSAQIASCAAAIRNTGWLVPEVRGDIASYQAFIGVDDDDFHGPGTTLTLKGRQRELGVDATGRWDVATRTAMVQSRLVELGYRPGDVDGIPGPLFRSALREFQRDAGLVDDAIPGRQTLAALRTASNKPVEPPAPVPAPPPAPAVPIHRIAGTSRFDTAVAADAFTAPAGVGVVLYVEGTPDRDAAVLLGARAGLSALPVRAGSVPSAVARRLGQIAPAWIAVIGGTSAFPEATARAAAQAAATK